MKSKKSYPYIIIAFIASFSLSSIAYAGGTVAALDFNSTAISSFSNQDVSGTVSIEDNGNKLHIVGNSWKKISLPYNVTQNTVLEFVYYSNNQGEIQGIGMSKTNNLNEAQTFQLYGTQNWGVADYADYANSVPSSKHYVIPIGQYFTGTQAYLFFANDDDANNDAQSIYKDVKIYENTGGSSSTGNTGLNLLSPMSNGYVWDDLNIGKQVYIDRSYTYTNIPQGFAGRKYLQTANNDKSSTKSTFLSFNVDQPVNVYVAFDERISTIPTWLEDWIETGETVGTGDTTLKLYSKEYPAGTVTLGGNNSSTYSMYTVMLSVLSSSTTTDPTSGSTPVAISSVSKSSYTLDVLDTGKQVYNDRSYTFTNVPANLIGNDYILTANNDKNSTVSSFLSFDVNQDVKVYVAYDHRSTSLPSWMGGWVDTGDTLTTTDTTLEVYSKEYPAGTITLGANKGDGYSMYSVIVGSTGNSGSSSGGTVPSTDMLITLSWTHSSPEDMDGYIVYTGSTAQNASNEVADITVNELSDPLAPTIDFWSNADLGLNSGDTVCFRTKARSGSELSNFSAAACKEI